MILLTRIFILRIIPFPKEPKLQRTAKKSSFPFLRHLQKFIYTVLQFPAPKKGIAYKMVPKGTDRAGIIRCAVILAHSNFPFAYNSIPKGTRCATNCLKMHFVSIFATSAEVFIRCAVILAHSNFPFTYNSVTKETKDATNC